VVAGRAYSRLIISHLTVIFGLVLLFTPLLVHIPLPSQTTTDPTTLQSALKWRLLFASTALVLMISAAMFAILGSGESTGWAEGSWNVAARDKMGQTTPMLRPSAGSWKRAASMDEDEGREEEECGVVEMRTLSGAH